MALLGRFVAEHRQMDRGLAQAGELQPRIESRAFARVSVERLSVGGLEIGDDRLATRLVVDADEPGRPAIADRGRQRRELEQRLQDFFVRRLAGAKASHVAPPGQEIGEPGLKRRTEVRRLGELARQFRHRGFPSSTPPFPGLKA